MAEPTLLNLRPYFNSIPLPSGAVCGVYVIRHRLSGRVYIGSSTHVRRRWSLHRSRLRRGVHSNRHLQNAWTKYGDQQFDWLLIAIASPSCVREREREYIQSHRSHLKAFGFNHATRPDKCESGWHHSPATRMAMSKSRIGQSVHTAAGIESLRLAAIGNRRGQGSHYRGRLNAETVNEILCACTSDETIKAIAHRFKISVGHISSLRRGDHWRCDAVPSLLRELSAKPKYVIGENNHASKLNASQVRDIRARVACGEERKAVASSYGIRRCTVDHIIRRIIWKHVA